MKKHNKVSEEVMESFNANVLNSPFFKGLLSADKRLKSHIVNTLCRLPTKDRNLFINKKDLVITQLRRSAAISFDFISIPFEVKDIDKYEVVPLITIPLPLRYKNNFKFKRKVQNITMILFSSDFCDKPLSEIHYTIAHELAHVFLGHTDFKKGKLLLKKRNETEIKTDRQVIKWGFKKELEESGIGYIKIDKKKKQGRGHEKN